MLPWNLWKLYPALLTSPVVCLEAKEAPAKTKQNMTQWALPGIPTVTLRIRVPKFVRYASTVEGHWFQFYCWVCIVYLGESGEAEPVEGNHRVQGTDNDLMDGETEGDTVVIAGQPEVLSTQAMQVISVTYMILPHHTLLIILIKSGYDESNIQNFFFYDL